MHDHLQTSHTGAGVYNASNTSPISDLEAFVTALKRAGKFNQLAVHERVKVVQIPLLDPLMQQSDPIIVLELPLPLSPHRPLALRPPFTPSTSRRTVGSPAVPKNEPYSFKSVLLYVQHHRFYFTVINL